MERLHPGVYIEEVSSGVRPIEGVSTSTTAFLGMAEAGPLEGALMVTSFIEFQKNFGGFLKTGYLAHAALQFFNNGGKRLYVVRVANGATVADVGIADRKAVPAKSLTVVARSAGKWGNDLTAVVGGATLDTANELKLTLLRAGVVAEVFDNLSMNPDAANFVERVVAASSQLVNVTVEASNDSTAAGTSVSGATPATSLPANRRRLYVDLNGDGAQLVTLADPVTTDAEIAAAIQTAVRALTPQRSTTPPTAFSAFSASPGGGVYTLTSGAAGKRSSVRVTADLTSNAAALLKLGVASGGTETVGAAVLRPAAGSFPLGGVVAGNLLSSSPGSDGATPQDSDFEAAFARLDGVRDVNILAVPGIGTKPVVNKGNSYCSQRQDCFFVGDMSVTDDTKEEAQSFVNGLAVKASYAAVYFPWVLSTDPTGASIAPVALPPSGFVAGIYARTDARRGVWKAPAGTETSVGGAVGLLKVTTDAEQDTLNPLGVNVIRAFPGAGIVLWGARTLATQANPEYRYVPIRRLAIFLEQSIYSGIQWAVFEPNDDDLWASLRLNVGAFMMRLFREGAFQGDTPSKAFFVKCDGETNPQAEIDAGVVNILVGFAPLKPAEFVVLKISQKAGDAAA